MVKVMKISPLIKSLVLLVFVFSFIRCEVFVDVEEDSSTEGVYISIEQEEGSLLEGLYEPVEDHPYARFRIELGSGSPDVRFRFWDGNDRSGYEKGCAIKGEYVINGFWNPTDDYDVVRDIGYYGCPGASGCQTGSYEWIEMSGGDVYYLNLEFEVHDDAVIDDCYEYNCYFIKVHRSNMFGGNDYRIRVRATDGSVPDTTHTACADDGQDYEIEANNVWHSKTIGWLGNHWYKIFLDNYKTYEFQFDDDSEGSGSYEANIQVSLRRGSTDGSVVFENIDKGYYNPPTCDVPAPGIGESVRVYLDADYKLAGIWVPEGEYPLDVMIIDNDPQISYLTTSDSDIEQDKSVNVNVELNCQDPGNTTTVDYSITGGDATNGMDYSFTSGTLTFDPLETSNFFSFTINEDYYDEPDETLVISLTNESANASIGVPSQVYTNTYTYTIFDDDEYTDKLNLTENSVYPTLSESVKFPDLAYNQGVYGMVYQKGDNDNASLYFYTIEDNYCNVDSQATPITTPVKINQGGGTAAAHIPKICRGNNTRFGVVWQDRRIGVSQIFFTEYDANGSPARANEVQITKDSDGYTGYSAAADVVYNSSQDEYAIVWNDNSDPDSEFDIYFGLYDPVTSNFSSIKVSDTGEYETDRSSIPCITWSGSYYGIVWWQDTSAGYEVSFARISADGTARVGPIIKIADAEWHTYPKIAWNDTGNFFGIVYERNNEVLMARMTENGVLSDYDLNLSQSGTDNNNGSRFPNITDQGTNLYVVWQEGYDIDNPASNYKIYYAIINQSGAIADGPDQISSTGIIDAEGLFSGLPVAAYNNDDDNLGVIWGQYYSTQSNNDIYLLRY